MSIIDRLFRKKRAQGENPDQGREMIRFYDRQGQDYLVPRGEYQEKVLPGQFRDAWADSNALYGAIAMALNDGFFDECLLPAQRLATIDDNPERSTTILGIVYLKLRRLAEAQEVLQKYLDDYGLSGVVLTNLAKVQAEAGDNPKAEETLLQALEVDPNQDNALAWWGALHHERGGPAAFLSSMERIASIKGSWRAQLWIARSHLEKGQLREALDLYAGILPLAQSEPDAMMMIAGDLGNNGHPSEVVSTIGAVYSPSVHGPMAGLNLAQACIELGKAAEGLRYCEMVESLSRYDLTQHVDQLKDKLRGIKAGV